MSISLSICLHSHCWPVWPTTSIFGSRIDLDPGYAVNGCGQRSNAKNNCRLALRSRSKVSVKVKGPGQLNFLVAPPEDRGNFWTLCSNIQLWFCSHPWARQINLNLDLSFIRRLINTNCARSLPVIVLHDVNILCYVISNRVIQYSNVTFPSQSASHPKFQI